MRRVFNLAVFWLSQDPIITLLETKRGCTTAASAKLGNVLVSCKTWYLMTSSHFQRGHQNVLFKYSVKDV